MILILFSLIDWVWVFFWVDESVVDQMDIRSNGLSEFIEIYCRGAEWEFHSDFVSIHGAKDTLRDFNINFLIFLTAKPSKFFKNHLI